MQGYPNNPQGTDPFEDQQPRHPFFPQQYPGQANTQPVFQSQTAQPAPTPEWPPAFQSAQAPKSPPTVEPEPFQSPQPSQLPPSPPMPQQQNYPPQAQQEQPSPEKATADQQIAPNFYYAPEEELLRWSAPNRPFKKRNREYYTTIAIIVFLLSIILFFANQLVLIAVIISFAFVSYVLAAVPPEKVEHGVTSYGIRTEGKLYFWGELGRFWFSESFGQKVLHIEYFSRYLSRLSLLLGEIKEEDMKKLLLQYLPYQTPLPTFVEKAADWLQKKIPLEKA